MPIPSIRKLVASIAGQFSPPAPSTRRPPRRHFAHRLERLEDRTLMTVQAFPLATVGQANWEISTGQVLSTVKSAAGDVRYTVRLDAGERISFTALADQVNLNYSLLDPTGKVILNSLAGAGRTALLNPYSASMSGTYTIVLKMPSSGAGSYWLNVAVNSGLEGTGTAAGLKQDLNFSFVRLDNGIGRYAWIGQADAGRPTDSFTIDLTSQVGRKVDLGLTSRGANFSGQNLDLVAPDGRVVARGSAWSPDGIWQPTGLRIAGFVVPKAGTYTVRFTSQNPGGYTLVVNDAGRSQAAAEPTPLTTSQLLSAMVANGWTTQSTVSGLVGTLSFDRVFQSMTTDEVLSSLLRVGAINGYSNLTSLKAALPGRGVDLTNLRPDGVLGALSVATYGNLLSSVNGPEGALKAKLLLQTSFNANRVGFLGVFSTAELVQLFDDSITTSPNSARDQFMAYATQPPGAGASNIVKQHQLWVHDGQRLNNPTPVAAVLATQSMPAGSHVIHLSDFVELSGYGLGKYPGSGFLDKVDSTGKVAPYYMIWMDQWTSAVKSKITTFFTQFKALGGKVDMVVMDIESVGMDYYRLRTVDHRVNPSSNPSQSIFTAIMSDPRWPGVRDQLLKAGLTQADLNSIATWAQGGREASIWNAVMQNRLAKYIDQAIYQPLKQLFPNATVSNYGTYLHSPTVSSGSLAALTQSPFTIGSVNGNTQAVDLYGYSQGVYTGNDATTYRFQSGINELTFQQNYDNAGRKSASGLIRVDVGYPLDSIKAGDKFTISNPGGQPFDPRYNGTFTVYSVAADRRSFTFVLKLTSVSNPPRNYVFSNNGPEIPGIADFWTSYRGFVADVKLLRTQTATSNVPLTPWISSPNWLQQDQGKNHALYAETVFHAGLSGAQDFLWWKHTAQGDPAGTQFISKLLSELDSLIGYVDRKTLTRTDVGFDDDYVLSGMEAGGKRVYRLTPDPSQAVRVLSSSGTVRIQVGTQTVTIPNASIYTPPNPASNLGYWIVQTKGTTQLVGGVSQVLANLNALNN